MEKYIDKYHRIPTEADGGYVYVVGTYRGHMGAGETLLIASARAIVISELGYEVEIPEELL